MVQRHDNQLARIETKLDDVKTNQQELSTMLDTVKTNQNGLSSTLDAVYGLLHTTAEMKASKQNVVTLGERMGVVEGKVQEIEDRMDHLGAEQKGFFQSIMNSLQQLLKSKDSSDASS